MALGLNSVPAAGTPIPTVATPTPTRRTPHCLTWGGGGCRRDGGRRRRRQRHRQRQLLGRRSRQRQRVRQQRVRRQRSGGDRWRLARPLQLPQQAEAVRQRGGRGRLLRRLRRSSGSGASSGNIDSIRAAARRLHGGEVARLLQTEAAKRDACRPKHQLATHDDVHLTA